MPCRWWLASGNVIAVVVTAQDGQTTQTYTVTVTRAGSSDASLSALSLSGVTLTPAFASGTTAYTASVANSVTETTVAATADAGAAYEVKLNDVVDQDGVVGLAVGSGNVITVVVTAAGWEDDTDVHGDGDAGRVFGGEAESAFAERGDAIAGVCVGDDGVHGVGGARGDGDDGDGVGSGGCGL